MYYGIGKDALKKLYVKDSMSNRENGFCFKIKNLIDSGAISGVSKLVVDGEERDLEGATITMGDAVRKASEISWSKSLYVPYGSTMEIFVPGELGEGEHTVEMTVNAPEIGKLTIPITDTL